MVFRSLTWLINPKLTPFSPATFLSPEISCLKAFNVTNKPETHAVLTGDIVKSRNLSPEELETVREVIRGAVRVAEGWNPGLVFGEVEFFRGDAWQMLLTDPSRALRTAVLIRAHLRARKLADSRISIGIGPIADIHPDRVSLSTGEAFHLSGHALDKMTLYWRMTVALPKESGPLAEWLPIVAHLCDTLIREWTPRQAEIVGMALDPAELRHEEIAERVTPPITRQAVTGVLDIANWIPLDEAIQAFESNFRWY